MSDLNCWNCGASLAAIPRPISRQANCLTCHAELHACRLCRHFAPRHPAQCMEDRAEPPTRKDVANFCDWFEPTMVQDARALDRNAAAKANLDALFAAESAGGARSTGTGSETGSATGPAAGPATGPATGEDTGASTSDATSDATAAPPALSKEAAAKAELERLFGRKT